MREEAFGPADVFARRAALDLEAWTRARGVQGRTRVRPAGGTAAESRVFHIVEATMLDEEDPEADRSGTTSLTARACDAGQFGEIKIAFKFPQRIRAQGAFHLGCTSSGYCGVAGWAPSAGGSDVAVRAYAAATPIDSFNGLTPATLNWNNRGSLSLGASLGTALIAQCYATQVSEYGPAILASGIANDFYTPDEVFCALRYPCGSGVEMDGVLLELQLDWQNVWYYPPGRIEGALTISRGDTANVWTTFGFYNPA